MCNKVTVLGNSFSNRYIVLWQLNFCCTRDAPLNYSLMNSSTDSVLEFSLKISHNCYQPNGKFVNNHLIFVVQHVCNKWLPFDGHYCHLSQNSEWAQVLHLWLQEPLQSPPQSQQSPHREHHHHLPTRTQDELVAVWEWCVTSLRELKGPFVIKFCWYFEFRLNLASFQNPRCTRRQHSVGPGISVSI